MPVGLRWFVVGVALWGGPAVASAQDSTAVADTTPRRAPGHFHIGLTVHDIGLSFGNAPRVTGVRINVQDADLERVNGLNLTFWKPREPFSGTVNGIQAGILPGSATVNGVAIGLGGVVTERRARWLTIGLYNSAYELHGVQIGVINRAKNNKAPFKILPVLNVHL